MAVDWNAAVANIREDMMGVLQHLKTNAEISWEERQTTEFLAGRLGELGLRVQICDGGLGVIGEWGPASGPVVALRADMDALWQEVHGEWRANHSCGHHAHMTTVLGAVTMLKSQLPEPDVRIRVIFQPAEEMGEGALYMVDKGAVDDVEMLFGLHLRPIQELRTGQMSAAIKNGGAMSIRGDIHGLASHGARPHLGVNAIEVAFAIAQAVQTFHINPMIAHSAKMTVLQAGGKNSNIIPDRAHFAFDLRAQKNEALDELANGVEARIRQVADIYGATVELERGAKSVAAEVGEQARAVLAQAIENVMGPGVLQPDVDTPGAEDFHFYTTARPGLQATMLGLGCDLAPGLHHPLMTFHEEAILDGMKALAEAVRIASQNVSKGAESK